MKNFLSRLVNTLPKRVAAGALIALAFALPVAASAADMVQIEAQTGVANMSNGDTTYGSSVNMSYNQVIKVEVTYDNDEAAGSNKVANNLRVHINVPTTEGKTQTITTTTSADNSNTVTGSATVNLDGSDAYLQYIPGTAVWKHAVSANSNQTTEQQVSDDVVTNGNGLVLENENPCQAGSVTVQVREMVPGVSIDKYVRAVGTTNWSTSINANPGDTVQYEIAYKNTGNTGENSVVIRDELPANMAIVPNTTYLKDSSYPNGTLLSTDAVTGNGIVIGNYLPGAAGYVMFNATVPSADKLACGNNQLRNIGMVQPQGMGFYYNTADVNVNKTCANTPTYTCDAFGVATSANRTVTVNKFQETATNGATFNNVVINWGDNTTALTTNNAVGQTHQYSKDGTYVISATAHFTVNGKDVTATGSCNQTVSFTTPGTPTTLVNTGAGNVVGLFAAVTVAGAFAHRLFLSRKFSR